MTQIYRTTKIPVFYFNEIESHLAKTREFVSVSEFIRDSIKEKLNQLKNRELTGRFFLLAKEVVFNEETMALLHRKVLFKENEKGVLKKNQLRNILALSLDINYLKFLSKFLVNFARLHPFNDGNKRTSWLAVDIFLRLNNKKIALLGKKNKETEEEIFIWQNSANRKTAEEVSQFLEKHLVDYADNSEDVLIEMEKSIKENKLLLERLSR